MIDTSDSYFNQSVDWLRNKISTTKMPSDIKVTFNEPDYNNLNPSIHAWFESPDLIAHIALWKNYTGEFSAIDLLNDKTLFDYSCEIKDIKEALGHVDRVFALLRK